MPQFTKFLQEQMPLNCNISSTVCCGRLQKGRGHHGAMPGLSSGWLESSRELLGRAPRLQMDRGLKNNPRSSKSAEASARVNSPQSLPRAALVRPKKLYKFIFYEKRQKNHWDTQGPCRGHFSSRPNGTERLETKVSAHNAILQNLRNCCEPHGVSGYWQATPLIKCNLQQAEESQLAGTFPVS